MSSTPTSTPAITPAGAPSTTPAGTAAKRPVAAPAAATFGIVAALAVVGVGVVGVREALVSTGATGGAPWLGWLLDKAEVLKPVDWMIPAGIASLLLGLFILVAALKPRKATHLAVGDAGGGVWIRRRDTARLAADSARRIDSVVDAGTKARGRKLRVTATVTGDAARVGNELADAITQRLRTVTPTPRVRTRVTLEER